MRTQGEIVTKLNQIRDLLNAVKKALPGFKDPFISRTEGYMEALMWVLEPSEAGKHAEG